MTCLGYKHTEEAKERIRLGKLGNRNPMRDPAVRAKMIASKIGTIPWNRGGSHLKHLKKYVTRT